MRSARQSAPAVSRRVAVSSPPRIPVANGPVVYTCNRAIASRLCVCRELERQLI